MKSKTIKVDYLARVEGEGSLLLKIKGERVTEARLAIFEPPRFFEAFLKGRLFSEAPDLTARICGICPIAYQMSAVHAMENAWRLKVTGPLRDLRRLIYCGEWIESHTLHVFMLHAPDFLGYEDAIRMAREHPDQVKLGLQLKKVGNDLVALLGGREIHPINVRVGGFYRVPTKKELVPLAERLKWAREAALATVKWTATLPFPEFSQDYEFVALRHPGEYPLNEGRLVSNQGLDIPISEYEDHFTEEQVPPSHALHSRLNARGAYLVGPLARYNLNFDRLPPLVQEAARSAGLGPVCLNPFQSIVVRSLEILYAVEEALRLIAAYEMPDQPALPVKPQAGEGCGVTEAPRGILYHHYRLDDQGVILAAKIVPPTSQNQKSMEADLARFAEKNLHLPEDQLTWQCEQTIRNYDPCISCATHFLRLEVEKE
ncbi:MAG: Ni/Fe hydrogenase subunit alpha [Thermodesulfobacteriota bacterium]